MTLLNIYIIEKIKQKIIKQQQKIMEKIKNYDVLETKRENMEKFKEIKMTLSHKISVIDKKL